jgi:hypothetical protein
LEDPGVAFVAGGGQASLKGVAQPPFQLLFFVFEFFFLKK